MDKLMEEIVELVELEFRKILGDSFTEVNQEELIDAAAEDVYETSAIQYEGQFNDDDITLACRRTIVEYISR